VAASPVLLRICICVLYTGNYGGNPARPPQHQAGGNAYNSGAGAGYGTGNTGYNAGPGSEYGAGQGYNSQGGRYREGDDY
jgi:hypothetical protein